MVDKQKEVFRVRKEKLNWFKDKISQLNKKAKKLNCSPITYVVGELIEVKNTVGNYIEVYHLVEVEGDAPKFEGWLFIATLQHMSEGNVIRKIVDVEIPEYYRTSDKKCDHCGYKRTRKDTYIIKHDNGEFKQVGKSCMKDFLGHTDPKQIAFLASFIENLREGYRNEDKVKREVYIDIEALLSMSAATIRELGWVSKAQATYDYGKFPTSEIVYIQMLGVGLKEDEKIIVTKEDIEVSKQVLEWITSLKQKDSLNDYEHNLVIACSEDYIVVKNIGICASSVAAYLKHKNLLRKERDRKEQVKDSEWIGKEKEKVEIKVKLVSSIKLDTLYGTTSLYRFLNNGNEVVWFSSRDLGLTIDKEYGLKGAIKKLNTYNGTKQTILTRCKIL